MKTKAILITLIAMLAVTALVFQSCKKDNNNPTPPVYTNGQGEVGEIGGTVKIEDPASPINGASIVIPEGALESNVDIKIVEGDNIYIPGHGNIQIVQFLPEGLEFLKEVEITLPWSQSTQTSDNTRAYYLDDENSTLKQIEIKSVDTQNKLTTAFTSHFSGFFTDPDELDYEIEIVKVGNNFGGYFNLQTAFNQIPAIINDGRNAEDIIKQEDGLDNCTVRLIFELYEKDGWFWEEVADMSIYIDNDKWSGGYSIWIDKSNSSMGGNSSFQIFNKYGLSLNQMTGTWMSGYPFVAIFDKYTYIDPDFSIDHDKKYRMSCTWGIVKDYNGFLKPYVWTWQYSYETEKKKWSQVASFTKDYNQNNIIDSYESSGENNPPNDPTNPSPSNNATNISTNTNLSWSCSDPEGDELDYNIYFGTSSNPPKVAEYYTSTTYNPGTLAENTTYYWYIKAYETGNNDNQSESEHWQFTTAGGGGSNTPPTALFTVSPSSGTTSTNFAFDAGGCTDNEDPTSNLQVRWDFDGNGSWDTGWDYDKTTNHQYSSENTYTAKLEVKDTEGLTDQYTKSITVSNGGGGGDLEWVNVSGGTFQMGSDDGGSDEQPIHTVTLSSFEITKYEVTNGQYCEFLNDIGCNSNGSHNGEEYIDMNDSDCQINYSGGQFVPESGKTDFPVIEVSWYGSNAFAQWAGGRLPTEAEWEFAARGGNSSNGYTYSGSNTVGDVTWYTSNSGGHTHQVGTKADNELGTHDMSGNVWEWCNDWYDSDYYSSSPQSNPQGPASGTKRVLRGGSWYYSAFRCRVANRGWSYPVTACYYGGFRVAR